MASSPRDGGLGRAPRSHRGPPQRSLRPHKLPARRRGGAPGRELATSHLADPGVGSDAARAPGGKRETLAMEEGQQRAASPGPQGPRGPPRRPRGAHLGAPRPGAGGGLVSGLSSSSSSLSREGLRGAKNREKLCQGPPPRLRPPDISRARLPVQGRPLGAGAAVSCVRSPARGSRLDAAQSIPAGEAGATRSGSRGPSSRPRRAPRGGARGRGPAPARPGLAAALGAGRVAAAGADPGPGARNAPPTTPAQGCAPQAVRAASYLALRSILTF